MTSSNLPFLHRSERFQACKHTNPQYLRYARSSNSRLLESLRPFLNFQLFWYFTSFPSLLNQWYRKYVLYLGPVPQLPYERTMRMLAVQRFRAGQSDQIEAFTGSRSVMSWRACSDGSYDSTLADVYVS